MVVHEAVGVAKPVIAFIDVSKDFKEFFTVGIVFEDGLLLVSTRSDMIHCTGVFYT